MRQLPTVHFSISIDPCKAHSQIRASYANQQQSFSPILVVLDIVVHEDNARQYPANIAADIAPFKQQMETSETCACSLWRYQGDE
jgi:hypothetical protein